MDLKSQINPEYRKPKLMDRVRDKIRLLHYSKRTEEAYTHWILRFILFHGKRHPQKMAEQEIKQFLTHLAVKEQVAASTQNQALCALVFLYKHVLNIEIGDFSDFLWAKRPKRMPVVFTKEESTAVLNRLSGGSIG
jgi:site-specific recombinase XerD